MGYWSKELKNVYIVEAKEIDTTKAEEFAAAMITKDNNEKYLYNRYGFNKETRMEKIKLGKMGEEVFRIFLKDVCNKDMVVDYNLYEGSKNVDKDDAFFNKKHIDVKFSMDNKNRGIVNCFKQLNFMIPMNQSVKDWTVWGVISKDMSKFYILTWIDKETYMEKYTESIWNNVKNYKLPLRQGRKINELVGLLA